MPPLQRKNSFMLDIKKPVTEKGDWGTQWHALLICHKHFKCLMYKNKHWGWDPFSEGICLLCSCCQSSIWCNTTVCDRLFFINCDIILETRIKPIQQSWKPAFFIPSSVTILKTEKNLFKLSNKANITQIDSILQEKYILDQ